MRAMRPTSSARTAKSTGTSSSSVRTRLKSSSCCTMTSLAPVHRCFEKVIVDSGNSRWREQRSEMEKSFFAQKRLFSHPNIRGSRREHPYRNFQSLACGVEDRDGTVAAFGSTKDTEAVTV